ncbi:MAG: succinate dehydrogenase cytochrome b subunit [Myxococcota bacterium]|nr:succinate dehydrogenase cytochrome b subunit [Myxococcota bacterium]
MSRVLNLYRSVIGKKFIVAVTGSIMIGFLILHGWGNLKVFSSATAAGVPEVDIYADFLRTMGAPILPYGSALWIIRIVVLVSLILHIVCVTQLARHNRRARPIHYKHARNLKEATLPARAMLYTGSIVVLFLGFHLAQFTVGGVGPGQFVQGDVYGNLYAAFQHPGYVVLYVSVMAIIGIHLYHGAWSLFQTLGWDNPDRNKSLRLLSVAVGLAIFLVFSAIPISFISGEMDKPSTQHVDTSSQKNR